MVYKFKTGWLKKNQLDRVMYLGEMVEIGQLKWQHRGVDMPIRGIIPEDQNLLKFLYEQEKEYVVIDEPKKPKKTKLAKDEPKDINQESEEVSIQEKEDE